MQPIILTTINARYIHAALGLRYIHANMGEFAECTEIDEFTLHQRAEDIAESLLARNPRIIGFGVYIWNVLQCTDVIRLIKIIDPSVCIVIGGPEVSFELTGQPITRLADHVITGPADTAFAQLCRDLDAGKPVSRQISAMPVTLSELESPYPLYTDEDLANRVLYVEASRGCPFKCEFCLSSLDKTAVAFELEAFLAQMQSLVERGARHFKFVDRTFNLKVASSMKILQFFLDHGDKELFLHFELIPDRLPDPLKELLPQFKEGQLQFEIGIQSFNAAVQQRISRRQDHDKTLANLRWLRSNTPAHIHADLIAGLPGEDLASFGRGFDLLWSLGPQEIQVGILKRLRGTPITRHTEDYGMRYMSVPPYRILSTNDIPFADMQRMVRFARYWDLVGNSGRFPATLPRLLGDAPFDRFMAFADWLFEHTGQTHKIALPRLFNLIEQAWAALEDAESGSLADELCSDFRHNGLKGEFRPALTRNSTDAESCGKDSPVPGSIDIGAQKLASRQQRHSSA